jgi:hypothetical protein
MSLCKFNNLCKESASSAGCCGIIGIIYPEQTRFAQHLWRDILQVWQVIVLFQQGQHVRFSADIGGGG